MPVPFDDDEIVSLTVKYKGKQVNRFDAMIRSDLPWQQDDNFDEGPDTRGLGDMFLDWLDHYFRRDIRRSEGNVAAEAVEDVEKPIL